MPVSFPVAQLMSTPVVAVSPQARVAEVLHLADARQIHHFPIVDRRELVGFVCTCDLAKADSQDLVMPLAWHHPATVSPHCPASDAARLLLLHGVGSLVIADGGGIRGIVTCEDLRHASPELAAVLEVARCIQCGAGEHLRPGPGGMPLCAKCKQAQPPSSEP
jgi:signal-transduction protein with cAMP-binding, CBS, and nucleotidyltransferase domain